MVYVDCTSTHAINMLTGIQRVVYNILEKAMLDEEIVKHIQPIVLSNRGFIPISKLEPHGYTKLIHSKKNTKKSNKNNLLEPLKLFLRKFPFTYQIIKIFYFFLKRTFVLYGNTEKSIIFTKEDTLLFLDATWSMPIWAEVANAKKNGTKIIFVIYDLIPIRFPQFCDKRHNDEFSNFFRNSLDFADMYVGISKTVMQDIVNFALESKHVRAESIKYDYFYLGSDFSKSIADSNVRKEMKDFFQDAMPVFLTVSTIEPRKNHSMILQAFDDLWNKGVDVKLCFIGKVGWKIEEFINIIKAHKMLGTKFMVFYDANDSELSYAYAHARSLIFASFAEGFGLPIIESMHYGLPVLASSLPIHQEIGGNNIEYFNSNDLEELISKIIQILQTPKENVTTSWIDWQDSTRMLWNKIA